MEHHVRSRIGRIASHPLLRGSAIVFAGSMVSNVGAYLYHLFLGRAMGPKGYGEFSSLNSLIYLLTVGTQLLLTILTRYYATCKAGGHDGQAHDIFVRVNARLLRALEIGLILSLVAAYPAARYLHLSSPFGVPLVYLTFALSALNVATASYSSGYQKFVWVTVLGILAVLLRLGFAIPFARFGSDAVLATYVAALAVTYGISFLPMRQMLETKRTRFDMTVKDTLTTATGTFFILLSMTSLYSTDIVLVRHFFPAEQAGWYAALAILGKIIFYASSAVGQVVLPVVSERSARKGGSGMLVAASVGLVTAVSLTGLAVYAAAPAFVVHLLFGSSYDPAVPLLVPFALFMTLYSVANILVTGLLALGRTAVWPAFVALAVTQILAIYLSHSSIAGVVWLNVVLSAMLVGVAAWYYGAVGKRHPGTGSA